MSDQNSMKIREIRKSLILETEKEIAQLRNALGAWKPGDNASLAELMPALRAAWLIVQHDQLTVRDIAMAFSGDETSDAPRQMLDDIEFAAYAFNQLSQLCEAAKLRVKVHADAITRATA